MYEELVETLRETADKQMHEAADAIEELQAGEKKFLRNISALEMENENLKRARRWIPVAEQLPKYGDWVLGIGPKRGYHVCEYRGITHFPYSGDSPWFSAKGRTLTITHWMPLPMPPEEDT